MRGAGALITGGAVLLAAAVYFGSRARPALAPADFSVQGPDALEFCSDAKPKFIPVANRASPVTLQAIDARTVRIATSAGKPIGPADVVRAPRLFAVNPAATALVVATLAPGRRYGEWTWPGAPGATTLFADLLPSATGQEMYVETAVPAEADGAAATLAPPPAAARWTLATTPAQAFVRDSVQLAIHGPVPPAEVAVFDLSPRGATGCAIAKSGMPITFDDPGQFAIWVLSAQGEPLQRFTLSVAP